MDELAAEMADEAEKPENQQNNKDSPEHKVSFGLSFFCFVCGGPAALMDFCRLARFFGNPAAFTQIRTNLWRPETEKHYKRFPVASFQTSLPMRSKSSRFLPRGHAAGRSCLRLCLRRHHRRKIFAAAARREHGRHRRRPFLRLPRPDRDFAPAHRGSKPPILDGVQRLVQVSPA